MKKLIAAAMLMMPGLALAQTKAEPSKAKTIINFGEATIDGTPDRPDGAYVMVAPHARFKSLIKLRDNFRNEVANSVHELR